MQEVKRGIMEQMDKVVEGFRDLVPDAVYEHLRLRFTVEELKLLFEGNHSIKISQLRPRVGLRGYIAEDKEILWFWGAVSEMSPGQQAALLEYVTGCRGIPAGLRDGEHVFIICRRQASCSAVIAGLQGSAAVPVLPVAHTCFRTLDLPAGCFTSQQQLQRSLEVALEHMGCLGIV